MSTTRVREVRKEAARASYAPRLKVLYDQELRARLKDELQLSSVMEVPRLQKITLNMGVGEAKTDAKQLDSAVEELTIIAGQRAQVRRARKSIAQFKIREGMPIGAKVTLRGARMYEFLDRLITLAIPRVKDFRGLNPNGFDKAGNYNFGFNEQTVFPEVDGAAVTFQQGMNITMVTTAASPEEGRELLKQFGFPFREKEKLDAR